MRWFWVIVACLFAGRVVAADRDNGEVECNAAVAAHASNAVWVAQQYERDKKQYGDNTDYLVRCGMLASRPDHSVIVYADTSGLGDGDIVEYYLIGEKSSHGYEALATSFASPKAVRDGLIFIGMPIGASVDYKAMRFRPKGERVEVMVEGVSTNQPFGPVPLSEMLWDYKAQKSVLTGGFVFTASLFLESPTNKGEKVFAPEIYDPCSIISDYNEPATVMDIPYSSTKGDAYGDNTVNTKYILPLGTLLRLTMRPEFTNGARRVQEITLTADSAVGSSTSQTGEVVFSLKENGADKTIGDLNSAAVIKRLKKIKENKKDIFLTVLFGLDMPLGLCAATAAFCDKLSNSGVVIMEPPKEGGLYYKAFIPDESMRKRENRYIQPLELHLKMFKGKIDGTVIKIKETWGTGDRPTLTPEYYPADLHGGIAGAVKDADVKYPIILIFASPEIKLGDLLDYIKPVRANHDLIHVYLEKPTATDKE